MSCRVAAAVVYRNVHAEPGIRRGNEDSGGMKIKNRRKKFSVGEKNQHAYFFF